MLKIIAIVVVGLLVALLVFAATKPDTFRVQRATSIKAPPEKIFPLINDFHRWRSWSPYEKLDPTMKRTYSGAASGRGTVYQWDGNRNIGKGRAEITDTAPPSKVTIKLDFIKPFEAHNIAEFTLEANGDSTNVTWAMFGPSSYTAKVMMYIFQHEQDGRRPVRGGSCQPEDGCRKVSGERKRLRSSPRGTLRSPEGSSSSAARRWC